MENAPISQFAAAVAADPQLQDRLRDTHALPREEAAEKISAMAAEYGLEFTPEEFLSAGRNIAEGLSDEQLDAVAGGRNIMLSIYTDAPECWS